MQCVVYRFQFKEKDRSNIGSVLASMSWGTGFDVGREKVGSVHPYFCTDYFDNDISYRSQIKIIIRCQIMFCLPSLWNVFITFMSVMHFELNGLGKWCMRVPLSGVVGRGRSLCAAQCAAWKKKKNAVGVCGLLVSLFLVQTPIVSTCPFGAAFVNPLLNDICFLNDISSWVI